jgi:undecaprenyl phosphate N,N'-diacetylbacillosamine 1-phosphate transferase
LMYRMFVKRLFDFSVALIGSLVALPIMLIAGLIIYTQDWQSPFFTQIRPGKNGHLFRLVKLRTMNNRKDGLGVLLPDDQRLTMVGRFIRKTSLDELPQLWNVIKGDMSLVGPRPLLVQYLLLYSREQKRRHLVKPGITGWAQVNGRNAISWDEKFRLDVWYVDHISFLLDLKILFLTVKKVFIREGISANGHVTIEPFKGN